MVLLKNKFFISFVLVLIAIIGFVSSFWYFSDRFDVSNKTPLTEQQKEIQLQKAEQEAEARSSQLQNENKELVARLQSVDDLIAIDDFLKQGEIGIKKITDLRAENKNQEAYQYINLLITRDDIYGFEATTLCVQMKADENERKSCEQRANDLARAQGLISTMDSLPSSYFVYREGDQ